MARILVVGGAGYVGGSVCVRLLDRGHRVWVLDDLSTGRREMVDALRPEGFTHAQAGDRARVGELLAREKFDGVMHFAACSLVEESNRKPALYLQNNVEQTRALLETMLKYGLNRLVFSSTCAVYGDPAGRPITESFPKKPMNPYGESKVLAEALIEELATTAGLSAVALRYFNAAGAEAKLRVGEWHQPETHLIPRVLAAGLAGNPISLYGTDYETPDRTCVRDYVHVEDLADAHEAALDRLLARPDGGGYEAFNLGSEHGASVRQVIEACGAALGRKLDVEVKPRRAGDPPMLVADARAARDALGFVPKHDLGSVITSALAWERKRAGLRRRAVFLDRDGTLNHDPGYLRDAEQLKLFPGTGEALARLKNAGFALVVVSNQSGVGRGLIEFGALERIHDRLGEFLRPSGALIDHYELCLHKPETACECRKPKAKLLLDAAALLGLDVSQSYMIGDKASDIGAGVAAGCRASLLVRTGEGAEAEKTLPAGQAAFVGQSLKEAVDWVLDGHSGA